MKNPVENHIHDLSGQTKNYKISIFASSLSMQR